jgi:DNA-3-methyladenine glycosylase
VQRAVVTHSKIFYIGEQTKRYLVRSTLPLQVKNDHRDSKKLTAEFYMRPTLVVARSLLGKFLVRHFRGNRLVGRIVETEAYRGTIDPAAHSYRGKTKRNEVMFRGGGRLYVYFTYGMHFCANVVTGPAESGEAVLIRAVEPIEGINIMVKNRYGPGRLPDIIPQHLTDGPAKLCEALSIRQAQNGTDLLGDEIYILDAPAMGRSKVGTSTRIGISQGKDKLWRFSVKGSSWVSR